MTSIVLDIYSEFGISVVDFFVLTIEGGSRLID